MRLILRNFVATFKRTPKVQWTIQTPTPFRRVQYEDIFEDDLYQQEDDKIHQGVELGDKEIELQSKEMELQNKEIELGKRETDQGKEEEPQQLDINTNSQDYTNDINQLGQELEWSTAAPHMMIEGFKFLEPINRSELAKQKLKSYQESLNLSVEGLNARLVDESYIKQRQAELFLHRMGPLTSTFLEQGVNFLNGHVFVKLFESNKLSILKELLNKGAFESADFVSIKFLKTYLPYIAKDPRKEFLFNILCFYEPLINVNYREPKQEDDDEEEEEEDNEQHSENSEDSEDSEDFQNSEDSESSEDSELPEDSEDLLQKILPTENDQFQSQFIEAMYRGCLDAAIKNRKDLNGLRIFWSLQKGGFLERNLFPLIIEELGHVNFQIAPFQEQASKEMRYVASTYEPTYFNLFIQSLLNREITFQRFITAYALSLLLLSKLKAIKKLLPEGKSNELHPIFQLIEFNLPKESSQQLILAVFQLLSHEGHSRIEFQNLKRSYNYWLKDYTQPEKTKYHSPLTKVLEDTQQPIVILYERDKNFPEYAKFRHSLTRSKEAKEGHAYFHQKDMIKHMLKKDYEPVLKYFITTYGLSARKETYRKLQAEMNRIESQLAFKNENQEAMFKLKAIHNIFFNKSLPQPLTREKLASKKENYDAQVLIQTNLIFRQTYRAQHQFITKFFQSIQRTNEESAVIDLSSQNPNAEVSLPEQEVPEEVQPSNEQPAEVNEAKPEGQSEAVVAKEEGGAVAQAEEGAVAQVEEAGGLEDEDEEAGEQGGLLGVKEGVEKKVQQLKLDYLHYVLLGDYRRQAHMQEQADSYDNRISNKNVFMLSFKQIDQNNLQDELSSDDPFDSYTQGLFPNRQFESESQDNDPTSMKSFFARKRNALKNAQEAEAPKQQQSEAPKGSNMGLNNKNKFEFCTSNRPVSEGHKVWEVNSVEELKHTQIDMNFLALLQTEQHVSSVSSGSSIAKYLFLHGKSKNNSFVLPPNKTLNIQFSSVVGTRAKSYQKYVSNTLFTYPLSEELYEELLLSQLSRYNRFEFKTIIAHLVCYNSHISNKIMAAICRICDKERIGYTFAEIAQLLKFNEIRVSSQSLQEIANLWQRFEVINEDMFAFLRQYCRKMQIPIKTEFYARYCKSLVKTKNFDKLEVIMGTVLNQIKPKPFKIDITMNNLKADQVALLEKEWKAKEQENYQRLYIELIEVIVKNLDNTVPSYLQAFFDEYRKMKPNFNEREFGYAFICNANKRERVEELLNRLDKQPEKGTSFMYDCLLQTILSNFSGLEELSEKMLDTTILKNRVVLSNEQILKSLYVFKKSSSSNSFSKFLDHCLRFQPDINKSSEIKRQMFYILNNNVEDVSVGGIFNLLDFIFNEKRQKQRVEYRAIKLSEEQKSRKLQEIQQATTKVKKEAEKTEPKKQGKKGKKGGESEKEEESRQEGAQKGEGEQKKVASKKEEKKKIKKQKSQQREKQNDLFEQILAQKQAKSIAQVSGTNSDEEFLQLIKSQTTKHESSRRKGLLSLGTIFEGSLQLSREEEANRAKELQKKNEKKEPQEKKKNDKKGDKKGKGDKK